MLNVIARVYGSGHSLCGSPTELCISGMKGKRADTDSSILPGTSGPFIKCEKSEPSSLPA